MLRSPVPWIVVAILLLASPAPAADESESAAAAEQQRLIEEFQKAEALEKGNLAAVREQAAFREVRSIAAPASAGQVLACAPLPAGGLVIANNKHFYCEDADIVCSFSDFTRYINCSLRRFIFYCGRNEGCAENMVFMNVFTNIISGK